MKIIELINPEDFDGIKWVNITIEGTLVFLETGYKPVHSQTTGCQTKDTAINEQDAKRLFDIHFGGGAVWSEEEPEGVNVSEHMEQAIQLIDDLIKADTVYGAEQIEELKTAQFHLINVFGRKDISHD